MKKFIKQNSTKPLEFFMDEITKENNQNFPLMDEDIQELFEICNAYLQIKKKFTTEDIIILKNYGFTPNDFMIYNNKEANYDTKIEK